MKKPLLIYCFIFIIIFITPVTFSFASPETVDAGLADNFEFSSDIIRQNKRIKAYTYFNNNSNYDLKATVVFSIDGKKIDQKILDIPKNINLPIWTSIKISEKSTLKAKLTSLQKDTDGVLEGVYSKNNETKITISPNDSVSKFQEIYSSINDSTNNFVKSADQTRISFNDSLKVKIKELEPEANRDNGLTFKKIWLWMLKVLNFILSNIILSLILTTLIIIHSLKVSKKGIKKLKKS